MNKRKFCRYSEPFKLEVLRDHYCNGFSMSFTSKKWGLASHTILYDWMKRYPIDSEFLSLPVQTITDYHMAHQEKSKEELLQQEVLNLRKALEMEKLRSRAFEKLIEIAEKQEGISILKKDGAKQ